MQKNSSILNCLFIVCLIAIGCSGPEQPEGMPVLHNVTFVVTQSGQPIDGVSVQLIPSDPSLSRWACGGFSDASGKVTIKTLGEFEGAPAGNYKATFYKELAEDTNPSAPADDPNFQKVYKSYQLIDAKYLAVESTPVQITVSEGTNDLPPVDLGPAVKVAQQAL